MAAIGRPFGSAPAGRLRLGLPWRVNGWILAGVLIAVTGALLPILQNSAVTTRGLDVQALEAEKARIEAEMSIMEAEVGRLTSLERIERRAQEIGLGPGPEPEYVSIPEAGPAPAKIPAEFLPRQPEPASEPAPWWRSLLEAIPLLN